MSRQCMLGLKRKTVKLASNHNEWERLFEEERGRLLETFGDRILDIEHTGSTAMNGIPAKPIIDVNVGIKSFDDVESFIRPLKMMGYAYMRDQHYDDRHLFVKGPEEKRTYHLNLVEHGSETGWCNPILFRDYLRTHPDMRNKYAALKRELAAKYTDDRPLYSKGKQQMIEEITDNAKKEKKTWSAFFRKTKNKPPAALLIEALHYTRKGGKALDVGGGALADARLLLQVGFDVTVIDKEEQILQIAKDIGSDRLHAKVTTFDRYQYPRETFDLVNAQFSLPFNPPKTFGNVWKHIKDSLVEDGIFCGQFFGDQDTWAKNRNMTFHKRVNLDTLLGEFEVIKLDEKEWDGTTTVGQQKHWHVFHIIARKK
jgi:tellurite methyltransferase